MRVGVDEAGKGPVLGSMFAAAVRADPAALPDGVADSKTLSPDRRESLAAAIWESAAAVGVAEVPVERIDDSATDMNSLTVDAHARALDEVVSSDGEVIADAGEVDAARFGRRVAERVPVRIDMDARHGADATDPVVSAASIVAKVRRDAHVAELASEYGDVGSGYASDPTTRAFLRDYVDRHGALPPCARITWQTCEDVLAAAEQAALDAF